MCRQNLPGFKDKPGGGVRRKTATQSASEKHQLEASFPRVCPASLPPEPQQAVTEPGPAPLPGRLPIPSFHPRGVLSAEGRHRAGS